jgi:hypothetical protein
MVSRRRYAKTDKGLDEIRSRGKNLRGRLRTMLILIDPSKTDAELRASAAQIGVEPEFLETLLQGRLRRAGRRADAAEAEPAPRVVTRDELARFRAAKAFINETIVDALGVRAFLFTLKLERCSTRADLAALLPDYAKAIRKFRGEAETTLLVERANELCRSGAKWPNPTPRSRPSPPYPRSTAGMSPRPRHLPAISANSA